VKVKIRKKTIIGTYIQKTLNNPAEGVINLKRSILLLPKKVPMDLSECATGQSVPDRVQSVPDRVQSVPDRVQSVPDRVQSVPDRVQLDTEEFSENLAESLSFHREWTLYIKSNASDWKRENFKNVYRIKTIKDMWQLLNNIPESLTGLTNIFFMENDIIPLWELDKKLWSKGGCWSTIIKGNHWFEAMNEACMILLGESLFDDSEVKGLCIVPVTPNHCIVKLWATTSSANTGTQLKKSLERFNCCTPRFKSFA